MKNHEKAIKEVVDKCMTLSTEEINNGQTIKSSAIFDMEKAIPILSKHYDTPVEPELEAGYGDWILWGEDILFLAKNYTHSYDTAIDVRGDNVRVDKKDRRKHTFVEQDLELLNTEDVKYELVKTPFGYSVHTKNSNYCNHVNDYASTWQYPTAHLAIKSAFNAGLGANLLEKAVTK